MKSTWRFRVFTFRDSWIWWLICLGSTAAFLKALSYNHWHIPTVAWVVFGIVIGLFYVLTTLHYLLRYHFKRSIKGYTDQGAAVTFDDGEVVHLMSKYSLSTQQLLNLLSTEMEDDVKFFAGQYPNADLRTPYEGMYISILSKPFVPMSSTNPSAQLLGLVSGLYDMNTMVLCWLGDLNQLRAITRHEAGHRLFEVVHEGRLSGTEQDMLMSKWGYG